MPTKYPDGMVDTLRDFLDEIGTVKQAFILIMERDNNEKSLLFIIDHDEMEAPQRKELFDSIAGKSKPYVEGMNLMFVPYLDGFAKDATENKLPFYRR